MANGNGKITLTVATKNSVFPILLAWRGVAWRGEPPQDTPKQGGVLVSGIEAGHFGPAAELKEQAETVPMICFVVPLCCATQ